ncbi:AMIN-like domain-containing (lipo)protein [Nonomuraea typhae]|uniref:AMIN-like domain-containing (lipo)protein n=1 Tax=Nonomuraea typhae TaxID=2603600 RepID=UPI001FE2B933|nr:hypothetical protein [Nonomuraea typhae]
MATLCLAVLCGCGTATPATTATPAAATAEPAPTGTAEVEVEHRGGTQTLVTGVRYADHGAYDRVVVDLKGPVPGYTARWVEELTEDGSGRPIDVTGGAYLQLTLTPADAHTEKGAPTWTGGPIFQAGLGNVRSVVRTGDFEGHVGVGLVLDRRAGFAVRELGSPSRLVVDVAH